MNSTIKTESMHEMLFEKRNKEYGAYMIRSGYNDTVVKSLVMVASTLLLFIGSAYAYNRFFTDPVLTEERSLDLKEQSMVVDLKPLEAHKAEAAKAHYTPKVDAPSTIIKDNADPEPSKNVSLVAPPSKGTEGDTLDTEPPIGDPEGHGIAVVTPSVTPVVAPMLIVDEMPEYPGGTKAMMEFFAKNVVYPERSKILGNQGTVFVNFVIGKDGKVSSYKIIKGVDDDCNEEALRIVAKMPLWKPGKNAGQAVPVMFNLPIRFKLD